MMTEFLQTALPIVIYILLIILLIVAIILGIKSIKTMDKLDKVVDDVNDKVQSLNGLFSLIDFTTEKVVTITDKITDALGGIFGRLFNKRRRKHYGEEE